MRLIDVGELLQHETKAGNYAPEMLVVGKGFIINAPTVDRAAELLEADKDGRCVVLPCKVGDKVYVVDKVANKLIEKKVIGFNYAERLVACFGHSVVSSVDRFGKSVFLAREEAEAALEGGAK